MERYRLKLRGVWLRFASLEELSAYYETARDISGEGYRTWREGTVLTPSGERLRISYNGCVWRGETLVLDRAAARTKGGAA